MSSGFQKQNNINSERGRCSVSGVNGALCSLKRWVKARVYPWFSDHEYIDVIFWVLPQNCAWNPTLPHHKTDDIQRIANNTLADPEFWKPKPVQLLLGADAIAKIITGVAAHEDTIIIQSKIGDIVISANAEVAAENAISAVTTVSNQRLDELLHKLWQADQATERSEQRTLEQQRVEDNFVTTHKRDAAGRFTVTIPLKDEISELGSSRTIALKRFMMLEKRLMRDSELKAKYCEFMREYEALGHMCCATRPPLNDLPVYYIPHHAVTKKFRVVFDASCATNTGKSFNEMQLLGEKLQKDLFEIVMRFRRHRFAVSADVRMMFRQIKIAPEQWDLQRIFWRESPHETLREYWLTVVTYGMTSAAHNAVRAMIQCAKDAAHVYPEAALAIQNDFYMDDCVTGADSAQEAIMLAQDIDSVLRTAGFELRKWKSNCSQLISALQADHENEMIIAEAETTFILGLKWLIEQDQFTYEVKSSAIPNNITKRMIVSCVAQLYDPNGFISPVTIVGKILIQDLWKSGLDWDEEAPEQIRQRWLRFWPSIKDLEHFRIDRWLGTSSAARIQLHGFADASEKAYGAVIYVRVADSKSYKTTLIVSKAKVAPLKLSTIPRLELSAARLLAQLLSIVLSEMGWEGCEYTLWCDSQVVLHWLNKEACTLKTYVANRVAEIQRRAPRHKWRYINTKENPADLLSRGVSALELRNSALWCHGPSWLQRHQTFWPQPVMTADKTKEAAREVKVHVFTQAQDRLTIHSPAQKRSIPLVEYVSDFNRAINILAHVIKFTQKAQQHNRRSRKQRGEPNNICVTNAEKIAASECLIKSEQAHDFATDIKALMKHSNVQPGSEIEPLKPILDKKGLLRAGGRIANSHEPYEMKHPMLVKAGSRLGWLIMCMAHKETKHGAVQVMMQYIRQKFWIPKLRSGLRSVIHKCVTCARHSKQFEQQLMAELPSDRVQIGKAFLHTGVDFAGPFMVKMAANRAKKCWVAIFVCFKTRAVHIDAVTDMTAIAFIACFERFICRRGRCERMYSDNGTTFVGAAKELRKAKEKWQVREVFEHLSTKGAEWRFMTPAAPHQGGIYEAAVKSMKFHLTRIVGARVLGWEQFITLLSEIEAILNSRPLTPLSDDCDDIQALTPGHFLIGEPLIVPLPFVTERRPDTTAVLAWQQRQTMIKHFWQRWRMEYLTSLQERKKWRRERENVRVGMLVVIKSELFPPAQWAMGRVCEIIQSADGLVRSVVVQTATNKLTRPISKICILPIDSELRPGGH